MTLNEYEKQGGFRDELLKVREMGQALTTLEELLPARPNTALEMLQLRNLRAALNALQESICASRRLTFE